MLIYNYTSYAKINLGLKVLNKREDGYHNLHSLFIEINLYDEIIFTSSPNFSLKAEYPEDIHFPVDDTNLISQAYRLMHLESGSVPSEYTIHLNKVIPIGSGLGGGSSNAATTLTALNELWELNYSRNKLETLCLQLGADIPFFIRGGFQLAERIGEKLTPQDGNALHDLHFLLVVPSFHVSTAWAYHSLNKPLGPVESHFKFAPISKPVNWQLFDNDFEKVIRKTYPEIGVIKENLQSAGALYAGLSGSGSTMFGVFNNLQDVDSAQEYFSRYQTFIASPVFHL